MTVTLILGGARSGKSSYAERLALARSPHPIYLATSRIWDDDHERRIDRHRRDRGPEWETLEEEKDLARFDLTGRTVVVDCVTLWLTNFFVDSGCDPEETLTEAKRSFDAAATQDNDWLFVSNEIGQGVHADTEAGRKFTDVQGFVNQHIAARAEHVVLMVAGIPIDVKTPRPKGPTQ